MIEIISPTRIEIDGKDAGTVFAFLKANPNKAAEIEQAFIAWHASHIIAVQKNDADLAAKKAQCDADLTAACKAHDSIVAALEADLAALGTKPEAVAIRKAQERAKKLEQLAALTAELRAGDHADLEATDAKP